MVENQKLETINRIADNITEVMTIGSAILSVFIVIRLLEVFIY